MVQIAKRKKGRPSKADLARRASESPATAEEADIRQRLRRRNVRYNIIDYDDDYIQDDEDERKREKKKLKLMARLNQGENHEEIEENESAQTRVGTRPEHALQEEECDEIEEAEENQDAEENHREEEEDEDKDSVVKGSKVESKGLHNVSVSANPPSGIPLPDIKTIEVILDKLQKKDTYGVFAEPVDPEELPDYHDVIDHPMDFATVRKKLANGSYITLEQFESDLFLICSNAMQYNAPETVYHKQARSIQELGRRKFEKLRNKFERSQIELKSEQKMRSNSLPKKSVKKPPGCASQEPVGFDFSSGENLATIGDVRSTSHPMQGVSCERPGNIDGNVEGNAFLIDANQDKAEDVLSGKLMLSKLGRKSFVLDESRRSSYNMSNQPITRSDSTFMTFESGTRQLVTVGVHAEYSYTRSLARFSASLGPIAWKIASHRIQQALPAGCKFGRGWVGGYEPLPTPILVIGNHLPEETSLIMKFHSTIELQRGDKHCKDVKPSTEYPESWLASKGNPSIGSAGVRSDAPLNVPNKNAQSRSFGKSENKGLEKVELNSLPSGIQNNFSGVAKFTSNTPTAESKPKEMVPRNLNALSSTPFLKQSDTNGVAARELPDGEVMNTSSNRRVIGPSSESTSNHTGRESLFIVHGHEQGLKGTIQSTRMFPEEAQKQQPSNPSPVGTLQVMPSVPSGQRVDSGNASAAAARAWMSVGEGGFKQGPNNSSSPKNHISSDSIHNSTREFHQHMSRIRGEFPSSGMSIQSDKNNFPFQAFVTQPNHTGAVSQFPNRPMVFPHLPSTDQPRFQMQSAWRGLSPPSQPRQKQDTLPPDLNIDFQSPASPTKQSSGSPAKQPSGVPVDSQQPDLALQL